MCKDDSSRRVNWFLTSSDGKLYVRTGVFVIFHDLPKKYLREVVTRQKEYFMTKFCMIISSFEVVHKVLKQNILQNFSVETRFNTLKRRNYIKFSAPMRRFEQKHFLARPLVLTVSAVCGNKWLRQENILFKYTHWGTTFAVITTCKRITSRFHYTTLKHILFQHYLNNFKT